MDSRPQPMSPGKGVSVLIYGPPGAGKTRFIGSAPNTLILRPPTDHTVSIEDPDNIEEWIVADWASMLEAFQFIQQGGHENYDWVWLDSISLFQDFGMDDVMSDAIVRKPARAVERGGVSIPEFGPDVGEYKINMERLAKWTRDMVGLANSGFINFGITAHPFEWFDPTKDEDVWSPWIQGKNMSPKICGYMNMVLYMQEVRTADAPPQRALLSDAKGHVGKDQFDCLPKLKSGRHGLVSPTMADLTAALDKARKGTTKKKTTGRKTRRRNGGK